MKKILLLLFIAIILSSCGSSYYQIYDVASNIKEQNNQYVVENEDCTVSFNFWDSKGNAAFTFYNKTDNNLYIPLASSSFIMNGYSKSLFDNVDVTVLVSRTETNTYKSNSIICVAPHSSFVIYDNKLVDRIYKFCDVNKDYPKGTYGENFTEEDTPLNFRYHILYSYNMNAEQTKALTPAFYVSRIENFKSKVITESKIVKDCNTYQNIERVSLKNQSPKRFYIKMSRSVQLFKY